MAHDAAGGLPRRSPSDHRAPSPRRSLHTVPGLQDAIENGHEDAKALRRQLHFLASLRDQYLAAVIKFPADLPLNWLLRETQVPHRPVNHAAAELKTVTRMQLRVLDHRRLLGAMKLQTARRGRTTVAIHETEGEVSRLSLEIADSIVTPAQRELIPLFKALLAVPQKQREHSHFQFGRPVTLVDRPRGRTP